jgi:hypothetical protein
MKITPNSLERIPTLQRVLEENSRNNPETQSVRFRALQRARIVKAIGAHLSQDNSHGDLSTAVHRSVSDMQLGTEYLQAKDATALEKLISSGAILQVLQTGKSLRTTFFETPIRKLRKKNKGTLDEPLSQLVEHLLTSTERIPDAQLILLQDPLIKERWGDIRDYAVFQSLGELKKTVLALKEIEELLQTAEELGITAECIKGHQLNKGGQRDITSQVNLLLPTLPYTSYAELAAFCTLFNTAFSLSPQSPLSLSTEALTTWKEMLVLRREKNRMFWDISSQAKSTLLKTAEQCFGKQKGVFLVNLATQCLEDLLTHLNAVHPEAIELSIHQIELLFPVKNLSVQAQNIDMQLERIDIEMQNRAEEKKQREGHTNPVHISFYLQNDNEILMEALSTYRNAEDWLIAISAASGAELGEFIQRVALLPDKSEMATCFLLLLISFEPSLLRSNLPICQLLCSGETINSQRFRTSQELLQAYKKITSKKAKAQLAKRLLCKELTVLEYIETVMPDWQREDEHPQYGGYAELDRIQGAYTKSIDFLSSKEVGSYDWEKAIKHLCGKAIATYEWAEIVEHYATTEYETKEASMQFLERAMGEQALHEVFVYIALKAKNILRPVTQKKKQSPEEEGKEIFINTPLHLVAEVKKNKLFFLGPWKECQSIYNGLSKGGKKQLAKLWNQKKGFSVSLYPDYYDGPQHIVTLDHHHNWETKDAEAFLFLHAMNNAKINDCLITSLAQAPVSLITALLKKASVEQAVEIVLQMLGVLAEMAGLQNRDVVFAVDSSEKMFVQPFEKVNTITSRIPKIKSLLEKRLKEVYNNKLESLIPLPIAS